MINGLNKSLSHHLKGNNEDRISQKYFRLFSLRKTPNPTRLYSIWCLFRKDEKKFCERYKLRGKTECPLQNERG